MKTFNIYTKFYTIISILLACLLVIVILFRHSEDYFPSFCGSHSLGNNFYALDWEGGTQVVVYCSNLHGKTCYGGLLLLQNTNMKCIDIRHNDTYIAMVARDITTNQLEYYIFDKRCVAGIHEDSVHYDIIQLGLTHLSDELQYREQCEKLMIDD